MKRYRKCFFIIITSYFLWKLCFYCLNLVGLEEKIVTSVSTIFFLLPSLLYLTFLKPFIYKELIPEYLVSMSKKRKVLLFLLWWFLGQVVDLTFMSALNLNQSYQNSVSISVAIILLLIYFLMIIPEVKRQRDKVTANSLRIAKIKELNNIYQYHDDLNEIVINEEVCSKNKFHNITKEEIIRYHLENNINGIQDKIKKTIFKLEGWDEYHKKVSEILKTERISKAEENSENITGYNEKNRDVKYQKLEEKIINELIFSKDKLYLDIRIEVIYKADNGAKWYRNIGIVSWKEVLSIYNNWLNGPKYQETIKRERSKVTASLRYDVLKRDNFTCQACGATVKDGAKLQVDHIIPVSKGGKTVLNNLQTLCESCNRGKSNKN